LKRLGPLPTLIEWDEHLPAFSVLLGEAAKAETLCAAHRDAQAAATGVAA
jgi:uncharacterized protein (UPF0276 family)